MKKYLMIALLICAIPATAFGQDVHCDECTHVVSVYQGHGGFIAMTDAEMVTWVATCEGVTRSGDLMPNADGMVSMLLSDDDSTSCYGDDEDNMFELGPIMDGGWYWITDATNSAVGGLVNMDILDNETTMLADAGDGVTMTMGMGAVLLKETATGRVGLLPNILPMMEMDPAPVNRCSYTTSGTTHTRETSNCMLGNGGGMLLVQGPTNVYSGMRDHLAANAMVTRPASGSVTVLADLWGNGTGHFTSDAAGDARLGHAGGTRLEATISASLAADGAGTGTDIAGTAVAGMTLDASTTTSLGELTIGQDTAYCSATNNYTATVTFSATLSDTQKGQVVPSIRTTPATGDGVAAKHTIMVVCPSASANQGVELVPENPFPTE